MIYIFISESLRAALDNNNDTRGVKSRPAGIKDDIEFLLLFVEIADFLAPDIRVYRLQGLQAVRFGGQLSGKLSPNVFQQYPGIAVGAFAAALEHGLQRCHARLYDLETGFAVQGFADAADSLMVEQRFMERAVLVNDQAQGIRW